MQYKYVVQNRTATATFLRLWRINELLDAFRFTTGTYLLQINFHFTRHVQFSYKQIPLVIESQMTKREECLINSILVVAVKVFILKFYIDNRPPGRMMWARGVTMFKLHAFGLR